LCGQDSGRGTFAHRHAVLYDYKTGEVYIPLKKLNPAFTVIDSFLSEEAVLGFEYGYACTSPQTLVLWEAQFGDFANGAQVVIDQFISSGEQKWGRLCGLVMLLPHGYEGMGPEHSSARLERYLQLCAQHNMQVCVPTTPAQIFHLLRRQMLRPFRKPLIVMTPKSLLRHKLAISSVEDLTTGHFQNVIPEIDKVDATTVRRIIFCSGRVYYDLLEARRATKQNDIAIVRVEQLYPFPKDDVAAEIKKYKSALEIIWCQEEPMNQGAWYQIQHRFRALITNKQTLSYIGRAASASTAAGYASLHQQEQNTLIKEALTP
ncbi:MAG: 2-oxoglutarate dehydrogenase E1 component, partial [Gammaproteobacteria bacterium]